MSTVGSSISSVRSIAAAIAAVLVFATAAKAQATVSGHVVDQGGLPLPGVRITIAPVPLGEPTIATTDGDGRFSTNVSAGRYTLSAELQGFSRADRALTVSSAAVNVEVTLIIAVEEQVSVSAPVEPIVGDALPMA